jgi:hypothetical protein
MPFVSRVPHHITNSHSFISIHTMSAPASSSSQLPFGTRLTRTPVVLFLNVNFDSEVWETLVPETELPVPLAALKLQFDEYISGAPGVRYNSDTLAPDPEGKMSFQAMLIEFLCRQGRDRPIQSAVDIALTPRNVDIVLRCIIREAWTSVRPCVDVGCPCQKHSS